MKKLFTLLMICLSVAAYSQDVSVTFKVVAAGVSAPNGMFIVGEATDWAFKPMTALLQADTYKWDTVLTPGVDSLSFYFITVNSWDSAGNEDWNYYKDYRENIDTNCKSELKWDTDRMFKVPTQDTTITAYWAMCPSYSPNSGINDLTSNEFDVDIFPNPSNGLITFNTGLLNGTFIQVFDLTGKNIGSLYSTERNSQLDLTGNPAGLYLVKATNGNKIITKKIVIN